MYLAGRRSLRIGFLEYCVAVRSGGTRPLPFAGRREGRRQCERKRKPAASALCRPPCPQRVLVRAAGSASASASPPLGPQSSLPAGAACARASRQPPDFFLPFFFFETPRRGG